MSETAVRTGARAEVEAPLIRMRGLRKVYRRRDQEFLAVSDVTMDIHAGDMVSLVGPSGCGKSTLLQIVAGLLAPSAGEVLFRGRPVTEPPEGMVYLFQQYTKSLLPWRSVAGNVALAFEADRRLTRQQVQARASEYLGLVGLAGFEKHYPWQLSGGMQQRVAIARALAMRPALMLFDEVTSALDPETVGEVLTVIRDLVREGLTCVLVTHEMRFAEEISDTVYFTEAGVIVEHGPPARIFRAPASDRTRAFLHRALGDGARDRSDEADAAVPARRPAPFPETPPFDRLRFAL